MKKLIFILILFSSCKAQQISSERTIRDSVVFREVEKEVLVAGFDLKTDPVNIDSLMKLLKSGVSPEVIEKTLVKEDPETKAKVGILIDELGNLTAYCEKQDELINFLLQEKDTYRFEVERIIERERENIFQQIGKYFRNTLVLIGLIIVGLVIYRFVR